MEPNTDLSFKLYSTIWQSEKKLYLAAKLKYKKHASSQNRWHRSNSSLFKVSSIYNKSIACTLTVLEFWLLKIVTKKNTHFFRHFNKTVCKRNIIISSNTQSFLNIQFPFSCRCWLT